MDRTKRKGAGRDGVRFVALPHTVIQAPAFRALSVYARALLLDIAVQYTGDDNGRLLCSDSFMAPKGWTSKSTLQKAKQELLAGGFIYETVKGHRPSKASWYALTWVSLDRLPGYDEGAVENFVRSAYLSSPAALPTPKPSREQLFERHRKNASLTPPGRAENPPTGPPRGVGAHLSTPPHGPVKPKCCPPSTPPHGDPLEKPSPVVELFD